MGEVAGITGVNPGSKLLIGIHRNDDEESIVITDRFQPPSSQSLIKIKRFIYYYYIKYIRFINILGCIYLSIIFRAPFGQIRVKVRHVLGPINLLILLFVTYYIYTSRLN